MTADRPDATGLREALEALAAEHESVMDSILPMPNREERESGRRLVRKLRALAAHPEPPEADPAAGERAACACPPDHAMGFTVHRMPCEFAATPDAGDASEPLSEDAEAYESLARKWMDASASARRLHIHFPADCLAEAAEFVRGLAARETKARAEAGEQIAQRLRELPTTRTKAWDRGWDSISLEDALAACIAREVAP